MTSPGKGSRGEGHAKIEKGGSSRSPSPQRHRSRARQLLDVLSDVKIQVADQLGAEDFPLPQFILVGTQSVGKSRLLEALAGERFNFVSGNLRSV